MVAEIDPDDLAALLAERDGAAEGESDGGLRIVDIRDRRAFDRGHVPGSECVPFPELTSRVAELDGADRVVTVCPHGVASRQAAQLIGSYEGTTDARVESLHGGIEAWERAGRDLVATDDDGDGGDASDSDAEEGPDAPF